MTAAPDTNTQYVASFTPLPWQIAPWKDTSKVLLLTGTAGGGKSRIAGEKVHAFLMRYPSATGLVLRKTREAMKNSVIAFMRTLVIGNDPRIRYKPSEYRFEYPNGSVLIWGGMKDTAQREQIRSVGQAGGIDIVWMEEATAFVEEDFNEILARLRGNAAGWRQIILTTNPDSPYHWIHKRLIVGGEASIHNSSYAENTYNPDDYDDTLNRLSGVQKMRLKEGKWVQAEGMVYLDFDENIHVINSFPIPSDWRKFRVIDFGFVNPFVCQWWAMNHDGDLYMYREIYRTEQLIPNLSARIKSLSWGENIEATVCDHARQERELLINDGFELSIANKDIGLGIQAVSHRIALQANKKPRLFFFRDALVEEDPKLKLRYLPTSTHQEMMGYVWDKTRRDAKEEPIPFNNHGMDCLRYICLHVDPVNQVDIVNFAKMIQMREQADGNANRTRD